MLVEANGSETSSLTKRSFALSFAAAMVPSTLAAASSPYPTRSVRLIVPFSAGGATDIMARLLARRFALDLKQTLVVENRGGAGGMIGTELAAKAPPDGYTLLFASSAQLAVDPSLYPDVKFDPVRDFEPIMLIGSTPNVILATPDSGIRSLTDLIAKARQDPGGLAFASPGVGSTAHLSAELLQQREGIRMRHVPYKGGGALLMDALGEQVPVIVMAIASVARYAQSGKLKALAVTGRERSTALPDVPTVAETLPGFDAVAWYGILTPAHTSPDIVATLHGELDRALQADEVKQGFAAAGIDPIDGSSARFAELIGSDLTKWRDVIQSAGLASGKRR